MTKEFMKKVYETYKADPDGYYAHGNYHYSIAYNACASIHTWIIRRKGNRMWHSDWEWYCPLPTDIC